MKTLALKIAIKLARMLTLWISRRVIERLNEPKENAMKARLTFASPLSEDFLRTISSVELDGSPVEVTWKKEDGYPIAEFEIPVEEIVELELEDEIDRGLTERLLKPERVRIESALELLDESIVASVYGSSTQRILPRILPKILEAGDELRRVLGRPTRLEAGGEGLFEVAERGAVASPSDNVEAAAKDAGELFVDGVKSFEGGADAIIRRSALEMAADEKAKAILLEKERHTFYPPDPAEADFSDLGREFRGEDPAPPDEIEALIRITGDAPDAVELDTVVSLPTRDFVEAMAAGAARAMLDAVEGRGRDDEADDEASANIEERSRLLDEAISHLNSALASAYPGVAVQEVSRKISKALDAVRAAKQVS